MSNNNIDYTGNMVKYTSRDYTSLLEDFFNMVPKLTDLWKPEANADPGVVLGKYLASVADSLGVNLDWLANEIFAPSVSQRKNAEKLFSLIGYNLGFYTAARTEVTFTNNAEYIMEINFGFNGSNFATLNAYTDITGQSRAITYNILPLTGKMGSWDTRSSRQIVTDNLDIFSYTDTVKLEPGDSVTRIAIEGELRSVSYSVNDIKKNNYIITLPSQHVDTTAVWIKAKSSSNADLTTQWLQVSSVAEFTTPEPRYAVTYDNYSNAQIQISNYLDQLAHYDNNILVVYWFDCSGVIGCVGENVLENLLLAVPDQTISETSGDIVITNLSNTVEMPHTYAITGKSPETAKEAYYNSRNYINTWDSLVTLPDFNRFLNREPGVDCGIVLDCQKALEYNLSVYGDTNLTEVQKGKKYLSTEDFPSGKLIFKTRSITKVGKKYVVSEEYVQNELDELEDPPFDWKNILEIGINPEDEESFLFNATFKRYVAVCYAIYNDFNHVSADGSDQELVTYKQRPAFIRYKSPAYFQDMVVRDYRPLQAMTVELDFGFVRVFPWHVCGQIFLKRPEPKDACITIIAKAKEALALAFAPSNRAMGQLPTYQEVVEVVENCDSRITHFDLGSPGTKQFGIVWDNCDIEYFNIISYARYLDPGSDVNNIIVAPQCIVT